MFVQIFLHKGCKDLILCGHNDGFLDKDIALIGLNLILSGQHFVLSVQSLILFGHSMAWIVASVIIMVENISSFNPATNHPNSTDTDY